MYRRLSTLLWSVMLAGLLGLVCGFSLSLSGPVWAGVDAIRSPLSSAIPYAENRVSALAATAPLSLTRLGQTPALTNSRQLALSGTLVYIADRTQGLCLVSIANPVSPTVLTCYENTPSAEDVALVGDYAYVATGWEGLRVLDVSNPLSPTEVYSSASLHGTYRVAIADHYAYMDTTTNGTSTLHIFDITNPAAPADIGQTAPLANSEVKDIVMQRDRAYVAAGSGGLYVFNRDSGSGQLTGIAGRYTSACPSGNKDAYAVSVVGATAYLAYGDCGLETLDVANPGAMTLYDRFDTPGLAYGVVVTTSYAFVGDTVGGLYAVRVDSPAVLSQASVYTATPMYEVAVAGDLIYAASAQGLTILRYQPAAQLTHLIAVLAFDNDLAAYIPAVVSRLQAGTQANPDVAVTVLVDGIQAEGDTRVLNITAGGVIIRTDLATFTGELDTSSPIVLGDFLTWARAQYPTHREIVILAGHGAGLAPEVHFSAPPKGEKPGMMSNLPPLPRGSDFTSVDVTSGTYLSTPELGRALAAATADGAAPFDLIFFDECFMGALDILYEVHPAAEVFLASPNYAWAAFAYDNYIAAITPTATPPQVAQSMVDVYEAALDAGHPNSLFWVRGTDVPPIAVTLSALGDALQTAIATQPAAVTHTLTAALHSQFVDTTLCAADLALCPPDEMIDLSSFAAHLQTEFGSGTAVYTAAGDILTALEAVHVSGISGAPWVKPETTWNIANVGLTILAPLTPTLAATPEIVWRASHYTAVASLAAIWAPTPTLTVTLTHPYTYTVNGRWDDFIAAWYAQGGVLTPTIGQLCHTFPTVRSMILTPAAEQIVAPGTTATFLHTVRNATIDTLALTLTATSTHNWPVTLRDNTQQTISQPLILNAEQVITVSVEVIVPVIATIGITDTIALTVSLVSNPQQTVSVYDVVRVGQQHSIFLPLVVRNSFVLP